MKELIPKGCSQRGATITTIGTAKDYAVFEGVLYGHRFMMRYYYAKKKNYVLESDIRKAFKLGGRNYDAEIGLMLIDIPELKDLVIIKKW